MSYTSDASVGGTSCDRSYLESGSLGSTDHPGAISDSLEFGNSEKDSFQLAYLLSVGFSSFTGMTSIEIVWSLLCFPSDNWMVKSSARLSESSCTYTKLIPGRRKKKEESQSSFH